MTIPELFSYLNTAGVLGALVIFVVGTYTGKLMWRWQHDLIIALKNERVADLERQLTNALKRGDEWQSMALQQTRTVDKSLEVVASSTTEKSIK
jgi:hypothetical protein